MLAGLPRRETYAKADLLVPELLVDRFGPIEIYYAPFDYRSPNARVMLVGITPGWHQMREAVAALHAALDRGEAPEAAMQSVKSVAAFSGLLRINLVSMLDGIGLAAALGVPTTLNLFGPDSELCHPTSVLRYPVFVSGGNYSGHRPTILSSPWLTSWCHRLLLPELEAHPHALVVPMGSAVSSVLKHVVGVRRSGTVLWEFPHPSGANAHRVKQFSTVRADLERRVVVWAKTGGM